jgi:hypothetical protein
MILKLNLLTIEKSRKIFLVQELHINKQKKKKIVILLTSISKKGKGDMDAREGSERLCWIVAGVVCEHELGVAFANGIGHCFQCETFKRVREEIQHGFQDPEELQDEPCEDVVELFTVEYHFN